MLSLHQVTVDARCIQTNQHRSSLSADQSEQSVGVSVTMLADKHLRSTPREGRAGMPAGQLSVRVSSPVARGTDPFAGLSAGEHKVQERVDQWSAAHRVSASLHPSPAPAVEFFRNAMEDASRCLVQPHRRQTLFRCYTAK
jgi:hypothetical protein